MYTDSAASTADAKTPASLTTDDIKTTACTSNQMQEYPKTLENGQYVRLPTELMLKIIESQLDDPTLYEHSVTPRNMQALDDIIAVGYFAPGDIDMMKRTWLLARIESLLPRIENDAVHKDLKATREEYLRVFSKVHDTAREERDNIALLWLALMCEWCIGTLRTCSSLIGGWRHGYGWLGGDLWEPIKVLNRHTMRGLAYLKDPEVNLELNGAIKELYARIPESELRWDLTAPEPFVWIVNGKNIADRTQDVRVLDGLKDAEGSPQSSAVVLNW